MNYLVTDIIDNPRSVNHPIAYGFRLHDSITPWGCTVAVYWRKELQ